MRDEVAVFGNLARSGRPVRGAGSRSSGGGSTRSGWPADINGHRVRHSYYSPIYYISNTTLQQIGAARHLQHGATQHNMLGRPLRRLRVCRPRPPRAAAVAPAPTANNPTSRRHLPLPPSCRAAPEKRNSITVKITWLLLDDDITQKKEVWRPQRARRAPRRRQRQSKSAATVHAHAGYPSRSRN